MFKLDSELRRYSSGAFNEAHLHALIKCLSTFMMKYKVCIDVISNIEEDGFFGLKSFAYHRIFTYAEIPTHPHRCAIKDYYICLAIDNALLLETLLRKGKEYLVFQFRVCDGIARPLTLDEQMIFETREEINEAIFDDPLTVCVIKDRWDCIGIQLMWRDDLPKLFQDELLKIAHYDSKI